MSRSHATVVAYLALFIAIGGAAYAVTKAPRNSVVSKSIKAGAVKSPDVQDEALTAADLGPASAGASEIAPDAVGGGAVANDSLTGADVDEGSLQGVTGTCPANTSLLGRLCVGGDAVTRTWHAAHDFCRALDLWMPSTGEATALGANHDIPGISAPTDVFWTDDFWLQGATERAWASNDDGGRFVGQANVAEARTICVTNPTDAR